MENIKDRINNHLWELEGRKIRMGVGCAWVGRGESYRTTLKEDVSLLMRCYETGFRFFDTAREYGESELTVGEFLQNIDRKTVFLATKAKYYREKYSDSMDADSRDAFKCFKRCFYESFERLRTDHIDLYQIHDTNFYGICMDEVIPFLEDRKAEGLIDYIGMGTRSIVAHCQAIVSGHVDSALSYLDYNLIKLSAEPLIQLTREKDAAFVNASVLLFGLLKSADPTANPVSGQARRRREFAREMQELCQRMDVDIISASLQYSLLNPDIDMTLNGIKRISNLESTIRAMQNPLYPEQWAEIARLQRTFENIRIEDEWNYE